MCYRLRQEQVKKNLIKAFKCTHTRTHTHTHTCMHTRIQSQSCPSRSEEGTRPDQAASELTGIKVALKQGRKEREGGREGERGKRRILNLFVIVDAWSHSRQCWSGAGPGLFSLAVEDNMANLEKCQCSKCLSGTVYYSLLNRGESVSAPLWEVAKTPEWKTSRFENRLTVL